MGTALKSLAEWVEQTAALTNPDTIQWCDGSESEMDRLTEIMLANGQLRRLNDNTYPNCYLHLSDPNDVARTEHLTFICSKNRDDAGPNNNWRDPVDGHAEMDRLFRGAMRGRTMYVIPYCMGPIGSPYARCGVEITDSAYVVANMKIMTRMGVEALKRIEKEGTFVKGLHSTGDLKIENRRIMHFPEELTIKSIGSGYGGNALLGKKCHALRIASHQGRQEGWLAEHMLIVGIEDPKGKVQYIAAAFPSACGKTNLAMLIPPQSMPGYKVWTVGDDIAWMHLGNDGQLWAINPEAGFFGVAPGTSARTNANAMAMLNRNTIFTNVAVTAANEPWWEGKSDEVPVMDWQGRPYPADESKAPAAHANSRFTVSAKQCPAISPEMDNPAGVPISAIIFGGRRASLAPLVCQSDNWAHGVLMGASLASETTAAATGQVGITRRDPMAMQPFCGYNFGDYWRHWLSFGSKSDRLPKIFQVNWFRQDHSGRFLWPGFGENTRILQWILERCEGRGKGQHTPIGFLPAVDGSIHREGLTVTDHDMKALLHVDKADWTKELGETSEYFSQFGSRFPKELWTEHQRIIDNLRRM